MRRRTGKGHSSGSHRRVRVTTSTKARDSRYRHLRDDTESPMSLPPPSARPPADSPTSDSDSLSDAPPAKQRGRDGLLMTALQARLAIESKVFTRFRSMRDAFRTMDLVGGTVGRSSFRRGIREWGIDLTDKEYRKLWRMIDRNDDGHLSFSEFCKILGSSANMPDQNRPHSPPGRHDVMSTAADHRAAVLLDAERRMANSILAQYGSIAGALVSWDRNHDGYMDFEEFRSLLHQCGASLTEDEFVLLIDKYDRNGDGTISDTEFRAQLAHFCDPEDGSSVKWVQRRHKQPTPAMTRTGATDIVSPSAETSTMTSSWLTSGTKMEESRATEMVTSFDSTHSHHRHRDATTTVSSSSGSGMGMMMGGRRAPGGSASPADLDGSAVLTTSSSSVLASRSTEGAQMRGILGGSNTPTPRPTSEAYGSGVVATTSTKETVRVTGTGGGGAAAAAVAAGQQAGDRPAGERGRSTAYSGSKTTVSVSKSLSPAPPTHRSRIAHSSSVASSTRSRSVDADHHHHHNHARRHQQQQQQQQQQQHHQYRRDHQYTLSSTTMESEAGSTSATTTTTATATAAPRTTTVSAGAGRVVQASHLAPLSEFLSQEEFRKVLKGWQLDLSADERYSFHRRFDTHDDSRVNYTEFCLMLAEIILPGIAGQLERPYRPAAGNPRSKWHNKVEPVLSKHVLGTMQTLENAFRHRDRSHSGSLTCMEVEELCRGVGLHLGRHFSQFMMHKHTTEAPYLTFTDFKHLLADYLTDGPQPTHAREGTGDSGGAGVRGGRRVRHHHPERPAMREATVALANKFRAKWRTVCRAFLAFDPTRTGTLTRSEFRGTLMACTIVLTDTEFDELVREFSVSGSTRLSYARFVNQFGALIDPTSRPGVSSRGSSRGVVREAMEGALDDARHELDSERHHREHGVAVVRNALGDVLSDARHAVGATGDRDRQGEEADADAVRRYSQRGTYSGDNNAVQAVIAGARAALQPEAPSVSQARSRRRVSTQRTGIRRHRSGGDGSSNLAVVPEVPPLRLPRRPYGSSGPVSSTSMSSVSGDERSRTVRGGAPRRRGRRYTTSTRTTHQTHSAREPVGPSPRDGASVRSHTSRTARSVRRRGRSIVVNRLPHSSSQIPEDVLPNPSSAVYTPRDYGEVTDESLVPSPRRPTVPTGPLPPRRRSSGRGRRSTGGGGPRIIQHEVVERRSLRSRESRRVEGDQEVVQRTTRRVRRVSRHFIPRRRDVTPKSRWR